MAHIELLADCQAYAVPWCSVPKSLSSCTVQVLLNGPAPLTQWKVGGGRRTSRPRTTRFTPKAAMVPSAAQHPRRGSEADYDLTLQIKGITRAPDSSEMKTLVDHRRQSSGKAAKCMFWKDAGAGAHRRVRNRIRKSMHTLFTAAAFCMFNCYVDGLATPRFSRDPENYREIGKMSAQPGYGSGLQEAPVIGHCSAKPGSARQTSILEERSFMAHIRFRKGPWNGANGVRSRHQQSPNALRRDSCAPLIRSGIAK